MKRKTGFTLVELLVVIAVIALLMSILMPVLRNARDQAMRILCKNREKNLLLGMTVYADNHNNRIPPGGGNWPWDLPRDVSRDLVRNMGIDVSAFRLPTTGGGGGSGGVSANTYVPIQYSDYFYCPANVAAKRLRRTYWEFTSGYRVAGYGFLWFAGWNGNGKGPVYAALKPADIPGMVDPSKKWVDRTDIPQASERELVIDVVQSSFNSQFDRTKYPNGNFLKIIEGGIGIDGTNHTITDAKAAGGNIGFADGHVEWRPFNEMKIRWRGGPYWWW